jgi:hypothetical protein
VSVLHDVGVPVQVPVVEDDQEQFESAWQEVWLVKVLQVVGVPEHVPVGDDDQ